MTLSRGKGNARPSGGGQCAKEMESGAAASRLKARAIESDQDAEAVQAKETDSVSQDIPNRGWSDDIHRRETSAYDRHCVDIAREQGILMPMNSGMSLNSGQQFPIYLTAPPTQNR